MTLGLLAVEWLDSWSSDSFLVECLEPVEWDTFKSIERLLLLGMSQGRALWTGPCPYPRYMASSLAPEWIEVRVGKELEIFPTGSLGYVSASFWVNRHG